MPLRIRLREPVEGHHKFWGRRPGANTFGWVAGAYATGYDDRALARIVAEELMPKYGPIDVVSMDDSKEVSVWEDGKEFNRRVDAAVAEAKKAMAAERPKSTWVGGVCPDYYRIPIPALGVEVMPFDLIDALQMSFNRGCSVKYLLRAGRKGPALDDLRKARNCLDREIRRLESEPQPTKSNPFNDE